MVVVISFFIFYYSFVYQVWAVTNLHWVSDIPAHAKFTEKFVQKDAFPVYSIWYILVSVLSGFSLSFNKIAYTSIFLLTGLVAIKYMLNYHILNTLNTLTSKKQNITLISFALIFSMPIISYYTQDQYPTQIMVYKLHIYLGNIAPNQWHNSTLILAMPINLLLFFYAVKYLQSERLYHFLAMGLLSVFSILCKPNFALAFLPVLLFSIFIVNLREHQYWNALLKPSLIAIPSVFILFYQWYYTFINNDLFVHSTKTIIAPFLTWGLYSPHIFISLLLSIAFPLSILIFYTKKIDRYLAIAWLTFIIALGMMAFLAEDEHYKAGNYIWGAIAANYILFLFSAALLLNQSLDWKAKISYLFFWLHFLSGFFLVGSFFIRQRALIM
jgi:hypothetical protein